MSDKPDIEFINGLIFKPPVKKDGSPLPDFVKTLGSIKVSEMITWLQARDTEWVNFDVKVSKSTGKWYASVDNWEPTKDQQYKEGMDQARAAATPDPAPAPGGMIADDDIPFSNYELRVQV